MISNFTCYNDIYKDYEFSFICSEKYPYEIIKTHKCVKYCDEDSLSSGACILHYNNSNNTFRENITL